MIYIQSLKKVSKKYSGIKPLTNKNTIGNIYKKNSFIDISEKPDIDNIATLPKNIRLNPHKVYTAPNTLLIPAKKVDQKLIRNNPIKIKNSPTKLLVKGKLIFAKENIKN